MFVIEEAKLPPPTPANAAIAQKTQYGVPSWVTATGYPPAGPGGATAATAVQLRPAKTGTANVYGSRSSAPTRLGIATRTNSCCGVKSNPAAARNAELTLQIIHTEKPRCSAKIDQSRLRRATRWPVSCQNVSSSGRQSSIHREPRRLRGGVSVVGAVKVCLARVTEAPASRVRLHVRTLV